MSVSRLHARLLAAAALAALSAGPVAAQGLGCATGNCGSGGALFAPNKSMSHRPDGCHPLCANNNYPLSDWNYIRKYCGPTFVPGSCYGYFQTKWRKWEDACPGGAGCGADGPGEPILLTPPPGMTLPPSVGTPPVTPRTPDKSQPLPQPNPQPKTDPVVPPKTGTDPVVPPKTPVDPPKTPVDPVTPPKVPLVPKPDGTKGLSAPTTPISIPVPMPVVLEVPSDSTAPRPLPDRSSAVPPLPELPPVGGR